MTDSDDGILSLDEEELPEPEDDDAGIDDIDEGYIVSIDQEIESNKPKSEGENRPYEILTGDEVVELMQVIIREVNTIVEIPATVTRILLNHYNWDTEKLMECYYGEDQEKLFNEAHVISPFSSSLSQAVRRPKMQQSSSGAAASSEQVFCDICFLMIPMDNLTSLMCGHEFCRSCWRQYLTVKIMDEGMGQTISCAAHTCDILVDDATVMKLIKEPKVRLKYQQIITNSFVDCNRHLRWCPQPDCGHVIKAYYYESQPVTCSCGHTFCFKCGEMWHDPVQCQVLKIWIKKCDDDSETSNWIAANTKECPRCRSTIEKDGGCNHMVCKRCKYDFCWICLTPWEPHGSSWYSCNRYNEEESRRAFSAQQESRSVLQRYLFYCNRYLNHMKSLKFENKLYDTVKDRMGEMQLHNMSWIEVQFLNKAVDALCLCRQTLMYTYVFAYYLARNNQSEIFENNQKDLENVTEQLSEYLERDITMDTLSDIKQKVQDMSRYCEHRRKVLLDHVHEGYEEDFWEYIDPV